MRNQYSSLAEKDQEILRLDQELGNVKKALDDANREQAETDTRVRQMTTEHDCVKEDFVLVQGELKTLRPMKDELIAAKDKLSTLKADLSAATNDLGVAKATVDALKGQEKDEKAMVSSIQIELNAVKDKFSAVTDSLGVAKRTVEALRGQLKDEKAKIDSLQDQLDAANDKPGVAKATVEASKGQMEEENAKIFLLQDQLQQHSVLAAFARCFYRGGGPAQVSRNISDSLGKHCIARQGCLLIIGDDLLHLVEQDGMGCTGLFSLPYASIQAHDINPLHINLISDKIPERLASFDFPLELDFFYRTTLLQQKIRMAKEEREQS